MTEMKLKKKLKCALFGLVLLASGSVGAQDVGFSQFYANPLYLNPVSPVPPLLRASPSHTAASGLDWLVLLPLCQHHTTSMSQTCMVASASSL